MPAQSNGCPFRHRAATTAVLHRVRKPRQIGSKSCPSCRPHSAASTFSRRTSDEKPSDTWRMGAAATPTNCATAKTGQGHGSARCRSASAASTFSRRTSDEKPSDTWRMGAAATPTNCATAKTGQGHGSARCRSATTRAAYVCLRANKKRPSTSAATRNTAATQWLQH